MPKIVLDQTTVSTKLTKKGGTIFICHNIKQQKQLHEQKHQTLTTTKQGLEEHQYQPQKHHEPQQAQDGVVTSK